MTSCPDLAVLLALAVGTCLAASPGSAPLDPRTLLSMHEFVYGQRVAISMDGRFAAYVWHDPDVVPPKSSIGETETGVPVPGGTAITVVNLENEKETVLHGTTAAWAPAWSPKDDTLAYLSDDSGRSGLWTWQAESRATPKRCGDSFVTIAYYSSLAWTPDGRAVILADTSGAVTAKSSVSDVEVKRSGNLAAAGSANMPAYLLDLRSLSAEVARIDTASGALQVLARGTGIQGTKPSPDGAWIAYLAISDYSPETRAQYQIYYDLWLVPANGGASKRVATGLPLRGGVPPLRWSPDGRYLAWQTAGLPAEQGLFVMKADDRTIEKLSSDSLEPFAATNAVPVWDGDARHVIAWRGDRIVRFDVSTGEEQSVAQLPGKTVRLVLNRGTDGPAYAPAKDRMVALTSDDATFRTGFYRVGAGDTTALLEQDRQIGASSLASLSVGVADQNNRIVFTEESADEPRELWTFEGQFQSPKRISSLGGAVWNVHLGRSRVVEWTSADGKPVHGVLTLPPGYDPARRYPLVVWMYEHLGSVHTFGLTGQAVFNSHLLATRGIACLYPDLHWERERVMQGLHEQVSAAIQAMVTQGIADPDRVGVAGHSSGGYDVLAVLATTPGIKAAIASAGVADMMSFYGISLIGPDWVEKQMGLTATPWEKPDRYIANSPAFHMDQVHTPLLIVQGTTDTENTIQMDMAFNLLRHLDRDVEYRRYAGEGHVPDTWNPADRLDVTQRIVDWWVHYLR